MSAPTASGEVLRSIWFWLLTLLNELHGRVGHPYVHERREVEQRRAVERELVVDHLVRLIRIDTLHAVNRRRQRPPSARSRHERTVEGILNLGNDEVP